MAPTYPLRLSAVFRFWSPLAATWIMMSLEGPFLAAVIARMSAPKENLAAYGVAFALAMLLESPIIMILSASCALVQDRPSLMRLGRFTFALNGGITALMVILLLPPVFFTLTRDWMCLPERVASLTHSATLILLPWPAAIGFRRFYQGILIRAGLPRFVAFGTAIRLASMALTALVAFRLHALEGALIGASALSVGVTMEALASRLMAAPTLRRVAATPPLEGRSPLTYAAIGRFYYPLALTTMVMLGINPVVTFFLGTSRMALESLATLPVVHSLVFLFGSCGMAVQETTIALLGPRGEGYASLKRFSFLLAASASLALAAVTFTPLGGLWFRGISGLTPDLARIAELPARILSLMPALNVWICFQRGLLIGSRTTAPITGATLLEAGGVIGFLFLGTRVMDWVGITASSCAFVLGRLLATSVLAPPSKVAARRIGGADSPP